jgi:hypothetical protein
MPWGARTRACGEGDDCVLPTFPDLRPLNWSDRREIEELTSYFAPYSEFNTVNMWCWHRKYRALCRFNDHLVQVITDAATGEMALSLLGKGDNARTLAALLAASRGLGCGPCSRLVPEEALPSDASPGSGFVLYPEEQDSDYVLSISEWVTLPGSAYQPIRNQINAFRRRYQGEFLRLDLNNPTTQAAMEDLFWRWARQKEATPLPATWPELTAIRRLFLVAPEAQVFAFGLRVDDRLIGFLICECRSPGWAIAHYWKGDRTFRGVYCALLHHACQRLQAEGCAALNIGQDLGLPGLAAAKRSFQPRRQLRKYAVAAAS